MDRRAIIAIGIVLGMLAAGVAYHRWSAPESASLRLAGPLRPHGAGRLNPAATAPAPSHRPDPRVDSVAPSSPMDSDPAIAVGAGIPATDPDGRIDISTADEEALVRLPGIGPVRAREIVHTRARRGGFRRVEDLLEVPGIGEKTLERLRPHVTVSGGAEGPPAHSSPAAPRIDINRASAAELETLSGIGPRLAAAIVADRARRGPFRSPDDLARVKGIGPTIVQKNRDRIVAGPPTP